MGVCGCVCGCVCVGVCVGVCGGVCVGVWVGEWEGGVSGWIRVNTGSLVDRWSLITNIPPSLAIAMSGTTIPSPLYLSQQVASQLKQVSAQWGVCLVSRRQSGAHQCCRTLTLHHYCDQSKVHDQITTNRYLNTDGGRFRPSRLPKRILPELAGVYGRSVGRERTDLLASAMICALVLVLGAS